MKNKIVSSIILTFGILLQSLYANATTELDLVLQANDIIKECLEIEDATESDRCFINKSLDVQKKSLQLIYDKIDELENFVSDNELEQKQNRINVILEKQKVRNLTQANSECKGDPNSSLSDVADAAYCRILNSLRL